MSTAAPSKVDGIIDALSGLENNIDSINEKLADMKKSLNSKVNKEIEQNMAKVNEMATKEAESIISEAKQKAQAQADEILKSGEDKLTETKSQIDAKFDESVEYVVSTVLET